MGRTFGFILIFLGIAGLGVTLVDWTATDRPWTTKPSATAEDSGPPDDAGQGAELASSPAPDGAGGSLEPVVSDDETAVANLDSGNVQIFNGDTQTPSESLPTVDIAPGNDPVSEGSDHVSFVLTLSEPVDHPIIIVFSTVDGSARSEEDYLSQRGTVTFKPGIVSAEIRTPLVDDQVPEDDEQFAMVFNGAPGIVRLNSRRAKATITDND